jgi:hypothetical protein
MAIHLSRPGHRQRQSADRSDRHADQLRADLFGRHEQLPSAAAGQPNLHHAGMVITRLQLEADNPGTYPGLSAQFSGDGFADMRFDVEGLPQDKFDDRVTATRSSGETLDAQSYAELARPSPSRPSPITLSLPACSQGLCGPARQAHMERDPVPSALPMAAAALMIAAVLGILLGITVKGYWSYLCATG